MDIKQRAHDLTLVYLRNVVPVATTAEEIVKLYNDFYSGVLEALKGDAPKTAKIMSKSDFDGRL